MNNFFGGQSSLALLNRIKKLEKQIKENTQNVKILLVNTEGHNITFEPPWEFLSGQMVSIMVTTGYGIITAILNRDERTISNISYHTSTGNITGTATVDNGVVNIPVSTIWRTTQMVFIPVKDYYFHTQPEEDNSSLLLNKIAELENKIEEINARNQYVDIADKITCDYEKCSVSYAYAENGVVIMCITIKPSFSGGTKEIFTISPEYAPRTITYGTYSVISTSVDFGKLNFVALNPSGACDIWLSSRLDFHEPVQFIYPLRN